MAFLKKAEKVKTQKAMEFAQMEQGIPEPKPQVQVSPVEAMLTQVLTNQGVIVENQQMILDAIAGTQNLMRQLSGVEEAPEEEEEVVEEEEEVPPPPPPKKKLIQIIKKKAK